MELNLIKLALGAAKGHVPVSKSTLATIKRIVDAAQGIKAPVAAGNWKGAASKIAAAEKAIAALKKDLDREKKNRDASLDKIKRSGPPKPIKK